MKYLWSAILLLACAGLRAQSKAPMQTADKWDLRLNPMGLVDVFDGNLSAGLERCLNSKWSVTTDLSFVLYSAYLANSRRSLGYIIKPAVRYYPSNDRKLFAEIAVFYKQVGYKINDWLGKDCVNGVPAYEELETFIFRKRVIGLNVQTGWRRDLTKNKLLRMELYLGLGIRYKWQDIKDNPRACYDAGNTFGSDIYLPSVIGVSVPHGLRLVYTIQ